MAIGLTPKSQETNKKTLTKGTNLELGTLLSISVQLLFCHELKDYTYRILVMRTRFGRINHYSDASISYSKSNAL